MRRVVCTAAIPGGSTVTVQMMRSPPPRTVSAVRLGSRPALKLPRAEGALLLLDAALWLAALLLIAAFVAKALTRWSPWAPLRRLPEGARLIALDLLDRQMIDRSSARWRFAYDNAGRRHHATDVICRPPLLSCGVVSRGAGVLLPGGSVRMLTHGFAPLAICPARRAAAERAITDRFDAPRAMPDAALDRWVETLHIGERAYVAAWRDAWTAQGLAEVNAALERRHQAASRLPVTSVDMLLRRCRSYVGQQYGA